MLDGALRRSSVMLAWACGLAPVGCGSAPDRALTVPGSSGGLAGGGFTSATGAAPAGGFGAGPPAGGAGAFGGGGVIGAGGTFVGGGGAGGAFVGGGGAGSALVGTGGGTSADGGPIIGAPIPAPVAVGCVTDVTPGLKKFPCDTTTDVVSIPDQCTKTACGVIVDVHGGSMSADMEDKNTNMRALGLQHGYIVIQPNALPNPTLLNEQLFVAGADDVRVMDILTQVIQAFHADTNRIHMTGFSEGGFMTWRWFCQHSDMLASVAPGPSAWKAGILSNDGLTPPEVGCQFAASTAGAAPVPGTDVPVRDIPALYMQGTKDGLVDPKIAIAWFQSNVVTALQLGPGTQIAGDGTFTRTRYLNPAGVPFELLQHDYTSPSSFILPILGHCYPGSPDVSVTLPNQLMAFACIPPPAIGFNWGVEVMKFFIAHPKS